MKRAEVLEGELATCQGRLAGLGEGCSKCWHMLDNTKVSGLSSIGLLAWGLFLSNTSLDTLKFFLCLNSVSHVQAREVYPARLAEKIEENLRAYRRRCIMSNGGLDSRLPRSASRQF